MIIAGQYRSGAHHFWSKGRSEGRSKNKSNYDLLVPIAIENEITKARELPTESRETEEGSFTLGWNERGSSSVEARVDGLEHASRDGGVVLDHSCDLGELDVLLRRLLRGGSSW